MDIGILGAGRIGGTVGLLWAQAGQRVRFSSTNPDQLAPLVARVGPAASAGTVAEAVAFGQVVLVALPASVVVEVLAAAGSLAGKTLIHAANAFARDGSAGLPLSALEQRFPAARWVRAYNTLQAQVLADGHHRAEPYVLLLSGDDAAAKTTVADLVRDSGFAPFDLGGTADSVLQDPGSPLWNHPLTERQVAAAVAAARSSRAPSV